MPAPKNNKYASKPAASRQSAVTILRSTAAERKAWLRKAAGGKFSEWAREALNEAPPRNEET